MTTQTLAIGPMTFHLNIPGDKLLPLTRADVPPSAHTPADQLRAALAKPRGLNAPFHTAVVPGDTATVVLDDTVPCFAELLGALLMELHTAGVASAAITLLVPPTSQTQPWLEELPDEFNDVTVQIHDPADAKQLSYLASTLEGRRIYMNRTLVEADIAIVLGGRRFDPALGGIPGRAELQLCPAPSNTETQAEITKLLLADDDGADTLLDEAKAAVYFLGMPYFLQVIEGPADTVAEILFGLPPSCEAGVERQEEHWRRTAPDTTADLAIAAITSDSARTRFADLAAALHTAREVLAPDGRLVLLCATAPSLDAEAQRLRHEDSAADAAKNLHRVAGPGNNTAALQWALAANSHRLFVASAWTDDAVEELFAVPIHTPDEVQKLIDSAACVAILPEAHLVRIQIAE